MVSGAPSMTPSQTAGSPPKAKVCGLQPSAGHVDDVLMCEKQARDAVESSDEEADWE